MGKKTEVSRVIFEATGIYHGCIETGLAPHGVSFARVNPRQARRFCEGAGQLAKTDRVDVANIQLDQYGYSANEGIRLPGN